MRSIQRNLTVSVVSATIILVVLAGALLYFYLRHSLLGQFDDLLQAEARAATGMVQEDHDGRLEFSFPRDAELRARSQKEYFEVYRADGRLLLRSSLLGNVRLAERNPNFPSHGDNADRLARLDRRCWTLRLPDGDAGRATAVRFAAEIEQIETDHDFPPGSKSTASASADPGDDPPLAASHGAATGAAVARSIASRQPPVVPLVLVLAEDHSATDHTLAVLLSSLLIALAVLSCGVGLAVGWSIRRGLLPLRTISGQAQRIGPASLDYRFEIEGLPAELVPLCRRLNELLARLEAGFNRERRFTGAVAHELRTPIAELRALGEVAVKWPEDRAEMARAFADVLGIGQQMSRIVTAMLTIARSETGAELFSPSSFDLRELVSDAYAPFESTARVRQLNVSWALPDKAPLVSDRAMSLQLIGNLFSNAVDYAPRGGCVDCRLVFESGAWELRLSNANQTLEAGDLPHLFEPFWRKDAARTAGEHTGLGLSVVAAYAKVIGATLSATLPEPGIFRICVRFSEGAEKRG